MKANIIYKVVFITLIVCGLGFKSNAQTYIQSSATYSWDASTTPQASTTTGDDVTWTSVTLPFAFTYFGTTYASGTTLYICSNGWVSFSNQATSQWTNACIPNSAVPNNMICAYWDDIYFDYSCAPTYITYNTYGTPRIEDL